MGSPYVGEIRMGGWTFAPVGWLFCNGQVLPISEFDTLFALIGTAFGGDGQDTFALPDLQGRVPIHMSDKFAYGQNGGVEAVTLTTQQMPLHNHMVVASGDQGSLPDPGNALLARSATAGVFLYGNDVPDVQLNQASIPPVFGSQPHDNMAPFQCITYIISLYGIFPPPP